MTIQQLENLLDRNSISSLKSNIDKIINVCVTENRPDLALKVARRKVIFPANHHTAELVYRLYKANILHEFLSEQGYGSVSITWLFLYFMQFYEESSVTAVELFDIFRCFIKFNLDINEISWDKLALCLSADREMQDLIIKLIGKYSKEETKEVVRKL